MQTDNIDSANMMSSYLHCSFLLPVAMAGLTWFCLSKPVLLQGGKNNLFWQGDLGQSRVACKQRQQHARRHASGLFSNCTGRDG